MFICSPVRFLPSWSHRCTKQYFTFCRCSLCIVRARSWPPDIANFGSPPPSSDPALCTLQSAESTPNSNISDDVFLSHPPTLPAIVYCDTLRAPPKPPAHPAAWFVSTGTRFGAKRRTFSVRTPQIQPRLHQKLRYCQQCTLGSPAHSLERLREASVPARMRSCDLVTAEQTAEACACCASSLDPRLSSGLRVAASHRRGKKLPPSITAQRSTAQLGAQHLI